MFPLGDDRAPGGPAPLVTVSLVILNVLVFLFELSQPSGALQSFIQAWGVVRGSTGSPTTLPRRSRCLSGARSSRRCSCTAGGCISVATCSICGFSGQPREDDGAHAFSVFLPHLRHRRRARAHLFQRRLECTHSRRIGAISGVLGATSCSSPEISPGSHTRWNRGVTPIAVLGFWVVIQLINGLGSLGEDGERRRGVPWHTSAASSPESYCQAIAARRP